MRTSGRRPSTSSFWAYGGGGDKAFSSWRVVAPDLFWGYRRLLVVVCFGILLGGKGGGGYCSIVFCYFIGKKRLWRGKGRKKERRKKKHKRKTKTRTKRRP